MPISNKVVRPLYVLHNNVKRSWYHMLLLSLSNLFFITVFLLLNMFYQHLMNWYGAGLLCTAADATWCCRCLAGSLIRSLTEAVVTIVARQRRYISVCCSTRTAAAGTMEHTWSWQQDWTAVAFGKKGDDRKPYLQTRCVLLHMNKYVCFCYIMIIICLILHSVYL